jgi:RimJ/RimL family protein N-acetyltransferase
MPEQPLEIVTPRLRLRGLSLEDARLVVHGDRETLGARIGARVPASWPEPALAESLPGIVARMAEHSDEVDGWVWAVIDPRAAAVVGDIGFHSPVHGRTSVEIGYIIVAEARGHGYATEAAAALMAWAFTQPGIERVTAQVEPGNAASLRIAERLDMRETTPEDPRYRCFERLKEPEPREGETP